MKPQREVASFVIRFTQDLWQDSHGEPRVEWRGQVRHVQNGSELRFADLADAMNFIQEALLKLTHDCVPKGDEMYQKKAMQESFKLWENFATSYTTMLTEAVQQTVKQSETLQKQMSTAMEQAMKPWWLMGLSGLPAEPPPNPEQSQIAQTLAELQQQLVTLTAKVTQLEQRLQQNS